MSRRNPEHTRRGRISDNPSGLWSAYEGMGSIAHVDLAPLNAWLASETSGAEVLRALRCLRRPVREHILERVRSEAISDALISWLFEREQRPLSAAFLRNACFLQAAAPLAAPFITGAFRESIYGERRMDELGSLITAGNALEWMEAAAPVLEACDIERWVQMATRADIRVNWETSRVLLRQGLYSLPQVSLEQLESLWAASLASSGELGAVHPEEAERLADHPAASVDLLCSIVNTEFQKSSQAPWVVVAKRPDLWASPRLLDLLLALRSPNVYRAMLDHAPAGKREAVFRSYLNASPESAIAFWDLCPDLQANVRLERADMERLLAHPSEQVRLAAIRNSPVLMGAPPAAGRRGPSL